MTAIDRTTYPCPGATRTREELVERYSLSGADHKFINANARGEAGRLTLTVLLTVRRDLGCFPAPDDVCIATTTHLATQLGFAVPQLLNETRRRTTLHHYRAAIRLYLDAHAYDQAGDSLVSSTIIQAASTMSDPADLINRAVEELGAAGIDLPAFSTLDRLAGHSRTQVHTRMYDLVAIRLTPNTSEGLDALLIVSAGSITTAFNRLKHSPGPLRPKTIRQWTERLDWLNGLIDPDTILEGITHTKLRQFAAEAAAMEVSDLLDVSLPGKRHTLLLSLIRQARARCRDELTEMLLRKVRRTQAAAREKLKRLQDSQRETEESLIAVLLKALQAAKTEEPDASAGHKMRTIFRQQGGVESLVRQCEAVSAVHRNNDLPLLWPIHAQTRTLLFDLLELLDIRASTQDNSLLDALEIVIAHRKARRDELKVEVNLDFASQRWQNFVIRHRSSQGFADRRAFEVCVFIHLADALQTGDLYVVGAESFDDYRSQLLPWADCQPRLADYCRAVGMPEGGVAFTAGLKAHSPSLPRRLTRAFLTTSN
jgi:hypothetical protein